MLPYFVREGLANLRRTKFAAFASTSTITVALVLVGAFGVVGYEAKVVSGALREQAGEMEAFIDQDAGEQTKEALHSRIQTMPGVARAEFISHEEAAKIFRREFGEEAAAFEDPTFLPASIRVEMTPPYARPDSMTRIAALIEGWKGVDDVVLNRDLLTQVAQNRRLINTVGLVLGGVVVLAAVILVANTIRLTIYARRLLIRTMKLVGATDRFVRRPFLVEGTVQGLVGGLAASGIVWTLYRVLFRQLGQAPMPVSVEGTLLGGLVGLGGLLGWIGAYFAARRFIQNVELH
ncbi:MAG: cell division protein FtsX [Salinibacter sp.]|uniref:cell division protein FtsX n=1 Tax=Salinibacter sp. TaxID=2065818 RepID=UPI0035D43136